MPNDLYVLPCIECCRLIKNCLCIKSYGNNIPFIHSIFRGLNRNKTVYAISNICTCNIRSMSFAGNEFYFIYAASRSGYIKLLTKYKFLPIKISEVTFTPPPKLLIISWLHNFSIVGFKIDFSCSRIKSSMNW